MNAKTRGSLIREARIARGYSQEQMSALLNISQQTYSTIEGDVVLNPRRNVLKKISEILDIPFETLLLGTTWSGEQLSEAAQSVARAYEELTPEGKVEIMATIFRLQRARSGVNRERCTSET